MYNAKYAKTGTGKYGSKDAKTYGQLLSFKGLIIWGKEIFNQMPYYLHTRDLPFDLENDQNQDETNPFYLRESRRTENET